MRWQQRCDVDFRWWFGKNVLSAIEGKKNQ
jgi:hypothetical protein